MIYLHAADVCLGLGFKAVLFADGVHNPAAELMGDDDLLLGLQSDRKLE